ncbi:MAG: LysR family transcriptional regulator [Actinomycetota bacterium]
MVQPTQPPLQIDVEALRALLVVVEHGSITRAAEALHLSRSAVSWRMKRLEDHVGQELIVRDGRSIRPSRAARAILDDARTVVETHDRIARGLGSADLTGDVTVAADVDSDVACLTAVLGSFRRVNPGVDVDLLIDRGWHLRDWVEAGQVDLAIMQVLAEQVRPDDRVLWSDPLVWVASPVCPYDEGTVPFVTYGVECQWRAIGEDLLNDAGVDHRIALSVPTTAAVIAAIEDGLGVGIIPRWQMTDRMSVWGPSTDLPPLPNTTSLIRATGDGHPQIVDALVDLLVSELAPPDVGRPASLAATDAA